MRNHNNVTALFAIAANCTMQRQLVRCKLSILNQETKSIYKYQDAFCIVADKLLTCMLKHIFLLVPLADITCRMSYPDAGRSDSPVSM